MLYGDGDFNQSMLNEYYRKFYGYGVNSLSNVERLKRDAFMIIEKAKKSNVVVDFGGAGDDGKSIIVETLKEYGSKSAFNINPGDPIPDADIIYASHVLEHVYDLPETMQGIADALLPDGLLIVDVPNSVGLLLRWKMPMLDFNTKHINHFTLRDLLNLGHRYGFEMVEMHEYELENAPAFQVHFKKMDLARKSGWHVWSNINKRLIKLTTLYEPINVWGLGDITWHILSQYDLDILDYIDNDPAMRGQTYNGKPILEKPTNDAPIVIFAQGQRGRLIENIRKMGVTNKIVEI